ncbi:MAG TPA: hypothetical protein VK212_09220 [Lentimicrobium sp.]|nr:hypothetical protein [Lentimicrobium sp.]
MKHLLQTLIVFLSLIISTASQAQENSTGSDIITVESTFLDYSDGYIITLSNDTIYGSIKNRFGNKSQFYSGKVVLKGTRGRKTTYYPTEIKGYCISDVEYYLSIQDGKKMRFASLIVDGEIKLLKIYNQNNVPYSSGAVVVTLSYLANPYIELYLYKTATGETTKVMKRDFNTVMSVYFSDCKPVSEMILNKELRYDDLEIIVDRFNKCE